MVDMAKNASAVNMEDIVSCMANFRLQIRQVEFAKGFCRNHGREVATGDVHLTARRDVHPGNGELAVRFEQCIVVVKYGKKILAGQAEHLVNSPRSVYQVEAEVLLATPVSDAI